VFRRMMRRPLRIFIRRHDLAVAAMWIMRSPYSAASGLCVIMSTVCPKSLFDWRRPCRGRCPSFESRFAGGLVGKHDGGAINQSPGSATPLLLTAESSLGRCSRRCAMPSISVILFQEGGIGRAQAGDVSRDLDIRACAERR